MAVRVDIAQEFAGWEKIPGAGEIVERALLAASEDFGQSDAEFSVLLTGDEEMRSLNKQWRGMDKPTNVLSFPSPHVAAGTHRLLGDIVLACETVLREAEEENKNPLHHLAHLAVHGALHLFGLDHLTDLEAEAMEARERKILAGLGIADPYANGQRIAETA